MIKSIQELERDLKAADIFLTPLYRKEEVLSNPCAASYQTALKKEAERLKPDPLCELPFHEYKQYDTTGNRLSYEKLYFHRRRCLGVFAMAAWLYENQEYLSLTEDYLWAVCNEFIWALPAHLDGNSLNHKVNPLQIDLFAAETAQTLAEICYLLKDCLHPAVLFRCRAEIERRVFTPFLSRTSPYWWESTHTNWAAVCAGCVGMAAIYQMEDSHRLARLLHELLPVIEHFLSGFPDDGTCLEGLSYWTYGVSYFTAFADLLCKRTAGRIDLLARKKVREIAAFQGKCYFKGGHTVSFSDAQGKDTFRIGVTSYLARYFDDKLPVPPACSAAPFGSDPCARWCQFFRDFIWNENLWESDASPDGAGLEKACILPDAEWLIFRGSDGCGGAIKGGHNDEPHNHNDVGSFFFLLHGKEALADLGAGEYTKDYFSERRYTIFTNRSFSHSVPVIDGEGQKSGKAYAARDCRFEDGTVSAFSDQEKSGNVRACMDIAPAYGNEKLLSLVRSLCYEDKKRALTLCDHYTFSEPCSSIEERFISRQMPVIEQGHILLFNEDGEACSFYYNTDLLAASVSTDIHYRHEDGAEETIYLLRLCLQKPACDLTLTFTICW